MLKKSVIFFFRKCKLLRTAFSATSVIRLITQQRDRDSIPMSESCPYYSMGRGGSFQADKAVCMYVCVCVCVYIYMYVCECMYVLCMYVCMYVCMNE